MNRLKQQISAGAIILFLIFGTAANICLAEISSKNMTQSKFSSLPISFSENLGQWDERALFRAQASGAFFWFCRTEALYVLTKKADEILDDGLPDVMAWLNKFNCPSYRKEMQVVRVQFLGSNPNVEVIGECRLPYVNNYFLGNDSSRWRTYVPNYAAIVYKNIYPGIDLKYHADGHPLEYDFIIHPGADLSNIHIRYQGIDQMSISSDGSLDIVTKFGSIYEERPFIYQVINSVRQPVAGHFIKKSSTEFGFSIEEEFNQDYPLVIDPQIVYSTFLGGLGWETPTDLMVDGVGFAYAVGSTPASDFPVFNPYDSTYNGGEPYGDLYVTKFSLSGNTLVYSTYIGGSSADLASRMALDLNGNVFMSGSTISDDFPLVNPFQYRQSVDWDAVVLKLNSQGNGLIYSTYFGGNGYDSGEKVNVDMEGCAFVTGRTTSTNLPTNRLAFDTTFNGSDQGDAFLVKFTASGNLVRFCTYLGGAGGDLGYCVEIANDGTPIVAGITESTNFPIINAYDFSFNGMYDVFVSRFDFTGSTLTYSTYFGGNSAETPKGLVVKQADKGTVYISGETASSNFPMMNAYDPELGGPYDGYIAVLSWDGSELLYGTYLGGSGWDWSFDIDLDQMENIYVTGYSQSLDFPLVNPFDNSLGWQDCFVTVFTEGGDEIQFSTFLGGQDEEFGIAIDLDTDRDIYVMGRTYSPDFPLIDPFDSEIDGYIGDAFITKISSVTYVEDDFATPVPGNNSLACYPNPFNNTATLSFTLAISMPITLAIYDILGEKVAVLFDGVKPEGKYDLLWNASGIVSGVYFAKLDSPNMSRSTKLVLLK